MILLSAHSTMSWPKGLIRIFHSSTSRVCDVPFNFWSSANMRNDRKDIRSQGTTRSHRLVFEAYLIKPSSSFPAVPGKQQKLWELVSSHMSMLTGTSPFFLLFFWQQHISGVMTTIKNTTMQATHASAIWTTRSRSPGRSFGLPADT